MREILVRRTNFLLNFIKALQQESDPESKRNILADAIWKHPDFPTSVAVPQFDDDDADFFRYNQAWLKESEREMFKGEEVLRPDGPDDKINKCSALIRVDDQVLQIQIAPTRQSTSALPRLGIVTIICEEISHLVRDRSGTGHGPVTLADMARVLASHDDENISNVEHWRRYLRRLNLGGFVSRSMITTVSLRLGLDFYDIAFTNPMIYSKKPGRRGSTRQRFRLDQADRSARRRATKTPIT